MLGVEKTKKRKTGWKSKQRNGFVFMIKINLKVIELNIKNGKL